MEEQIPSFQNKGLSLVEEQIPLFQNEGLYFHCLNLKRDYVSLVTFHSCERKMFNMVYFSFSEDSKGLQFTVSREKGLSSSDWESIIH